MGYRSMSVFHTRNSARIKSLVMSDVQAHTDIDTNTNTNTNTNTPQFQLQLYNDHENQCSVQQTNVPFKTHQLRGPKQLHNDSKLYAVRFANHQPHVLAFAGSDKHIHMWNIDRKDATVTNTAQIATGHAAAILDIAFSNYMQANEDEALSNSLFDHYIFAVSADATTTIHDMITEQRMKRLRHHAKIINTVATDCNTFATAGDDCTIRIYDVRAYNTPQHTLKTEYPVLSLELQETMHTLWAGGIDNVAAYDRRKNCIIYRLEGHQDAVTGVRLSRDRQFLATNCQDGAVRIFDVRPYIPAAQTSRQLPILYYGAKHSAEQNMLRVAFTPDSRHVACGSSDRCLYMWSVSSGQLVSILPGHHGEVTAVDFSIDALIATASTDGSVIIGEF